MGTKPDGWLRRGLGAGGWTLGVEKVPVLVVREWEEGLFPEEPNPPERPGGREGPLDERNDELLRLKEPPWLEPECPLGGMANPPLFHCCYSQYSRQTREKKALVC